MKELRGVRLSDSTEDQAKQIVANYHVRNGTNHEDGSFGEIRITPKQFTELVTNLLGRSSQTALGADRANMKRPLDE